MNERNAIKSFSIGREKILGSREFHPNPNARVSVKRKRLTSKRQKGKKKLSAFVINVSGSAEAAVQRTTCHLVVVAVVIVLITTIAVAR